MKRKDRKDRKYNVLNAQIKQERFNDSGQFPKVILIDTTSFCNLKCSMCFHNNMERKKGIIHWDLFKKIVDEIAKTDKNARVWMVFFGEALLMKRKTPSIFDMINYAKNKELTDVVLNSNGTLMDIQTSRRLIEADLDGIYVGVDAFKKKTYDKIRVGGNYSAVVENIINLIKLKKEMNSKKPEVFVQFVEMEANKNEKDAFKEFWVDKGAIVKIRPMVSWAGLVHAPNLIMQEKDRSPCYWAMQTMSITDSGKVVICAVDLDGKYIAGDINTQSIKEVWNGDLKKFRKMHISKNWGSLPGICKNCSDWQSARADYHVKE